MIKKMGTINRVNEPYLYNHLVEPNSFAKALDLAMSKNKCPKRINNNNKKEESIVYSLDFNSNLNIDDRIKFHNSLRKF